MKFRKPERGGNDFAVIFSTCAIWCSRSKGASQSLNTAGAAFGVESKADTDQLGVITEEAIDYCRQDVAATTRLYQAAMMVEYATHPIDLPATAAYSSASIAKAYLRKMGIQPRLTAQPDFPDEIFGHAISRSMAAAPKSTYDTFRRQWRWWISPACIPLATH